MNNYLTRIFSFFSLIMALIIIFYFWIPLFVILFIGGVICFLISLVVSKISGHSSDVQVKVIKIERTQNKSSSNNEDIIDTTIANKDKSQD